MVFFRIVDPRRVEVAEASRLEYRERGGNLRRALGLAAVVLGLGFLAGLVRMQAGWPLLDAVLNPLLGAGLLAGGFATLVDLGVVLDCGAGTVVCWWGLVVPLRRTTRALKDFDRVETSSRLRGGSLVFPVRLAGPGAAPLELFHSPAPSRAEALAREISAFLGLPAAIWQPEPGKLEVAEAFRRRWSGRRGMARVKTPRPETIAYEQRFPAFVRVWGAVALPMGLLALLSPLTGIRFEAEGGGPAPAWLAPFLGTIFSLLGLLFLLGRRGIAIDGRHRLLTRWYGMPFRLWAVRRNLEPYRSVAIAREVRTHESLVYPAYRVLFTAPDGASLEIFEFAAAEDARARAQELAGFLGLETRTESEPEGGQRSRGDPPRS